jgi:hypothetical protein
MPGDEFIAIVTVVAGLGLALWALLRIRSGRSYTLNPPTAVTRKDDPFAFWTSLLPIVIVSLALIAGGLAHFLL